MTPKLFRNWRNYKAAVRRSKRLAKGDLIDHIDTGLSDLSMSLSLYRRNTSITTEQIMKETSLALAVMLDELAARRKTDNIR